MRYPHDDIELGWDSRTFNLQKIGSDGAMRGRLLVDCFASAATLVISVRSSGIGVCCDACGRLQLHLKGDVLRLIS